LQLNDEASSLVWSLPTEQAKKMLALAPEAFVDAVNDAFVRPLFIHKPLSLYHSNMKSAIFLMKLQKYF